MPDPLEGPQDASQLEQYWADYVEKSRPKTDLPTELARVHQAWHNEESYSPAWKDLAPHEQGQLAQHIMSLVPADEPSKAWVLEHGKSSFNNGTPIDFSAAPFISKKNDTSINNPIRSSGIGKLLNETLFRPINIGNLRESTQRVAEQYARPIGEAIPQIFDARENSPITKMAGGAAAATVKSLMAPASLASLPLGEGATLAGSALRGIAATGPAQKIGGAAFDLISKIPTPKSRFVPFIGQDYVRLHGGAAPLRMVDVFNPTARMNPSAVEAAKSFASTQVKDLSEIGETTAKALDLKPEELDLAHQLVTGGGFNLRGELQPDNPLVRSAQRVEQVFGKKVLTPEIVDTARDIQQLQQTRGEDMLMLSPDKSGRARVSEKLGKYFGQKVYQEMEASKNARPMMTASESMSTKGIGQESLGVLEARKQGVSLQEMPKIVQFVTGAVRGSRLTNQLKLYERFSEIPEIFAPAAGNSASALARQGEQMASRGWVRIPGDPNKFGKIAGGYMEPYHAEISLATSHSLDPSSPYMRQFKEMVVPWSIVAQKNNLIGNIIMANAGGVSVFKMPFLLKRAADEIRTGGPVYKSMIDSGAFRSVGEMEDVYNVLNGVTDLERKYIRTGKPFNPIGFAEELTKALKPTPGLHDIPTGVYQSNETLFKVAMAIDAMDKGGTVQQGAANALKWVFDYGDVSDSIKLLRQSPFGAAFVTYPLKAAPRIAEKAATDPLFFSLWGNALAARNDYEAKKHGIDPVKLTRYRRMSEEWAQKNGVPGFMSEWVLPNIIDATGKGTGKSAVITDAIQETPLGSLVSPRGVDVLGSPVGGAIKQIMDARNRGARQGEIDSSIMPSLSSEQTTERNIGMALPVLQLLAPLGGRLGMLAGGPTTQKLLRYALTKAGESRDRNVSGAARTVQGNIWPGDIKKFGQEVPSLDRMKALYAGTPEVADPTQAMLSKMGQLSAQPGNISSLIKGHALKRQSTNLMESLMNIIGSRVGNKTVKTGGAGE